MAIPTGAIRYNTDSNKMECFDGTKWWQIAVTYESVSNSGRGMFSGGHNASPGYSNIIDYVTFATTGNAVDFGDLTVGRSASGSNSSRTRGLHGGGYSGSNSDVIDYWTLASNGNAIDFGNLLSSYHWVQPTSDATRAIWANGSTVINVIQYVTMSSAGNSIDFGDSLIKSAVNSNSSCQSLTRGILGGGTPSNTNQIEYITVQSTGNASDFGDLSEARDHIAGCSNAHGGL